MAKAYSTIGTVLKYGAALNSLTKLCKIKSYPDLGGSPETIETTDLEDTFQTFVPGVQSMETMEFTCNYNPTDYAAVVSAIPASGEQYYQIEFGDSGAEGKFYWQGTHSVRINGGDVNAVREMTITIVPSSAITKTT